MMVCIGARSFGEATRKVRAAAIVVSGLVLLVGLHAAPQVEAKPVTVKGAFQGNPSHGIVVLAYGRDGSAQTARVKGAGKFVLKFGERSQARDVVLQMVGHSGAYRGMVVLGKKSDTEQYIALSGRRSVNLGKIDLKSTHAAVRRKPARAALSVTKTARTDPNGVPIGAGKLGLTRSSTSAAAGAIVDDQPAPDDSGPVDPNPVDPDPINSHPVDQEAVYGDADRDGVANPLDVDSDGDGVVDSSQGDGTGIAGQAEYHSNVFSNLKLGIDESINAQTGATPEQIDAVLNRRLSLVYQVSGAGFSDVGVDCFGLVYCDKSSGTAGLVAGPFGTALPPSSPAGSPWRDFDPSGVGLPNLLKADAPRGPGPGDDSEHWEIIVEPNQPASGMASGDNYAFIARAGPHGESVSIPTGLDYYFLTAPALKSLNGGEMAYPVAPGSPGTHGHPIDLGSVAAGGGMIALEFWGPQRRPIGAESGGTGGMIDIGNLNYGGAVLNFPQRGSGPGADAGGCQASRYTNLSSDLKVNGMEPPTTTPIESTRGDQPSDPSNTHSFTLDVAGCLADRGIAVTPGLTGQIDLEARTDLLSNSTQNFQVLLNP